MSIADQTAFATTPKRQLPSAVRLSPQFVNRLNGRIQRFIAAKSEIAGLLFGIPEDDTVYVQAFKSFPEIQWNPSQSTRQDDLDELFHDLMLACRRDPEVSSFDLIGWYSTRLTGGLHEADIEFHNRHFHRATDIALILKPEHEPNVLMEIFSRSTSAQLTESSHRWGAVRLVTAHSVAGSIEVAMRDKAEAERNDKFTNERNVGIGTPEAQRNREVPAGEIRVKQRFLVWPKSGGSEMTAKTGAALSSAPSRAARIPSSEERRAAVTQQTIQAGNPPGVPALRPKQKASRVPWISSAAVFVIAVGLTFAWLFLRVPRANQTPAFLRNVVPSSGLQLKVEGQGDRVVLSWNRLDPVVRAAKFALLAIDDGGRHRSVQLDAAQVANGSVLYRPGSDDVTFELEVHDQQNKTVNESVRVLDGLPRSSDVTLSTQTSSLNVETPKSTGRTPEPVANTRPTAPQQSTTQPTRTNITPTAPPQNTTQLTRANTLPTTATPLSANAPGDTAGKAGDSSNARSGTATASTGYAAQANPLPLSPNVAAGAATSGGGPGSDSSANLNAKNEPARGNAPPAEAKPAEPQNVEPSASRGIQNSGIQNPVPAESRAPEPSSPAVAENFYVPPKPVRQVLPNLGGVNAALYNYTSEIQVEVTVDSTGRVTSAKAVNTKAYSPLYAAAIMAARQWTFQPATLRGTPISAKHTILFQFQPANKR